MAENIARAGDQLVIVACCPRGPVGVLSRLRDSWRCPSCRSGGADLERVTLGPKGSLPDLATARTAATGTACSSSRAENGGLSEAVPAVAGDTWP